MKQMLTLAILCCVFAANAQIFWEEDFSNGIPDTWINEDSSGQNVLWSYCSDNNNCNFSGPIGHFYAATANNGFAFLNSNAFSNLNSNHLSTLTTPSIDCTGEDKVYIQFQTAIASENNNPSDNALLIISNGTSTKEFSAFPALILDDEDQYAPIEVIEANSPYYVTLDISAIAGDQENVQITWKWEGNDEYFWAIDDLIITTENPAEPENSLWFESFPFGANGWVSQNIGNQGGDGIWEWMPGGRISNGFNLYPEPDPIQSAFIHSLTAADGAMVFTADYFNLLDGDPTNTVFYTHELISPTINLSNSNAPIAIQFAQILRILNTSPSAPATLYGARFTTSMSYSTDGGSTWSDPFNTAPYTTPATNISGYTFENNYFYIPLPAEAAGSSEFKVKFTWGGDYYFWGIDDVAIVERPAWDMRVNRNFFSMAPSLITPSSQLVDIPFLADVVNNGSMEAENVIQEAFVIRASDGEEIHRSTQNLGDIDVDVLVENIVFEEPMPISSINEEGLYHGFYTVHHDMPDDRPEDDTLKWHFTVSDTTFAKENGYTRDIFPQEAFKYSYGNLFYVPNGDGWFAKEITFGLNRVSNISNRGVDIFLYKWHGDLNDDGLANIDSEMDELVHNYYPLNDEEDLAIITTNIDFDAEGYPLEDNSYYLVAIRYNYNTGPPLLVLVNDTLDYLATNYSYEQTGTEQFSSFLDIGEPDNFNPLGFGYNIVPLIRLHISRTTNTTNISKENIYPLSVYPNPCREGDKIYLDIPEGMQPQRLSIADMSGRNVFNKKLLPVTQKHITFDARNFVPGSYTIKLESTDKVATATLIVQ
ncbi:MAG: T9SS type A sorting domain-containing protein [Chitinophagales bacterium]|nr:T9SS type A sorting domain-containing protein [Chitinophagales bacterium]